MTNEQLRDFVKKIVEEKNATLDSEVKEQLISDMSQKLLDLMERDLIAALADSDVDKLNQLLDDNASDAQVHEFMASKIPNANEVIASVATRFRQMYLTPGN